MKHTIPLFSILLLCACTSVIVEFDIMLDTDFTWGDGAIDDTLMDVQNIVTHELGHGIGLADIYYCELETMYGYSYEGDTEKRTLFEGDIAGLQKLYGKLAVALLIVDVDPLLERARSLIGLPREGEDGDEYAENQYDAD